ncbi:unnamed protein product [Paramecium sonneborni]|uniref:Transmembrane protein n=1 Tax=Paramecium sonneborni TaxID=65129 RepID=A0A8S1QSM0_9CILI|nr:unnamed protein product [Paramecium sonneborni]
MIFIINLIVSLAFIWITYLVYSIKQFKHELIAEYILNFVRRLLFQSSIIIFFPLLISNGLEFEQKQFKKSHQYLKIIHLIDQLQNDEKENLIAYVNQEFSVKFKMVLLVPIVLLLIEVYLIIQIKNQEPQNNEDNNNLAISSENQAPQIIFQPKNVSEYVFDKNDEILKIESYIRNNNIEKMRSIEDVKSSYLNNQSDLLNKLQFTIDGKKPEKIMFSQYSNKQLANARHFGQIDESQQSPNFKTIHSQGLIENSDAFDSQQKTDQLIQRKINLMIGQLVILQIIFGYVTGVQEKLILSIFIIILSSCLIIDLFDDLIFKNLNGSMFTYVLLNIYNINVFGSVLELKPCSDMLLYNNCLLSKAFHKLFWSLNNKTNFDFLWDFSVIIDYYQIIIIIKLKLMSFKQTSGKVIIDTSHGYLEVELWSKEIPKVDMRLYIKGKKKKKY